MIKVDYCILADAVAASQGKHYIHGAGWDSLAVTTFPAVHPSLGVAVRLLVPWEEATEPHTVEVDVIRGADGKSILSGPPLQGSFRGIRSDQVTPSGNQTVHLALDLAYIQFDSPGEYNVVLRVDGENLATPGFHVLSLEAPE